MLAIVEAQMFNKHLKVKVEVKHVEPQDRHAPVTFNLLQSERTKHTGIELALRDFFDVQIYATLYFGSNAQPLSLIFDTGSSWLWVQTPDCLTCPSMNEFVYSESNTFQKLTEDITPIYYGTGEIQGFLSADTVCLDAGQKNCVEKMSMLATFS